MHLRHGLIAALGLTLLMLPIESASAQEGVSQSCLDAGISDAESCSNYLNGGGQEQAPVEEPQMEEAPAEEPYVEEAPVEEPQMQEAPVEEPQVEEAPPEEPYVEEAPVEEPQMEEAPVEEPQVQEAPAEEPQMDEAPVEEPQIQEQPAEEPAIEESPADEQPGIEPDAAQDQVPAEEPAVEDQPAEEAPAANTPEETAAPEDAQQQTEEAAPQDQPAGEAAPDEAQPDQPVADEAVTTDPVPDDQLVTDDSADTAPVADEQLTQADDPLADAPEVSLDAATEPLPEGATAEEETPLLDSAKEGDYTEAQLAAAAEESEPAPESDADAQVAEAIDPAEAQALVAEGTVMDAAPQFVQPQNVTIINNDNTVINNNTTVNNTTVNNYIYETNNQVFINNTYEEQQRIYRDSDTYGFDQIGDNRFRETVYRDDGSRVVTIRDQYGNLLERYVVDEYDNSYVLAYFEPRYYDDLRDWRDPGYDLPPIHLTISFRDYVMDWRYADEDQIYRFFRQPPVEKARRLYSVDEVKRSARLRDSVRRLEVGNLSFASGSASLPRNQVESLRKVADAMSRVLAKNPAETFLIEGHTDAVGSERSNLILSDKRANAVARILTEYFDIPPENLATQGYGEKYLRVKTQRAEPQNRRVTIRRITALVAPTPRR